MPRLIILLWIELHAFHKQMLSSTLRLNFCYLDIIRILHLRYYPKVIGHILKNNQKNKCAYFREVIQLIIMKTEMKMKNKSHIYDTNTT